VLVERYEAKLLRYATYLIKDYDVASDVTQDTFIKAYINLRSFKSGNAFSPWIYRILHNEAMNVIKRNKKTLTFSDMGDASNNFFVSFATDHVLDKNMLRTNVQKCLGKIDIKYQEVLALYFFDNLKYEEISEILHVPASTIGVRISRGKATLKKICQNDGVNYE
jgi:RNA polymerase sigma-70 factor (ECF subfamily)